MDKKELFKNFAKGHPELITYLKNNSDSSWQKLYEIYDIYGEDEKVWSPYFKTSNTTSYKDLLKNVNVDNLEQHINNFQKAIGVLQEFTSKGGENIANIKGPLSPRPINKFFGD